MLNVKDVSDTVKLINHVLLAEAQRKSELAQEKKWWVFH